MVETPPPPCGVLPHAAREGEKGRRWRFCSQPKHRRMTAHQDASGFDAGESSLREHEDMQPRTLHRCQFVGPVSNALIACDDEPALVGCGREPYFIRGVGFETFMVSDERDAGLAQGASKCATPGTAVDEQHRRRGFTRRGVARSGVLPRCRLHRRGSLRPSRGGNRRQENDPGSRTW